MQHNVWPCVGRVCDTLLYRISHQGGRRKSAHRCRRELQEAAPA